MSELLGFSSDRLHPDTVRDAWGKLDEETIKRYGVEQTLGYEPHFVRYQDGRRIALEVGGPPDGRVIFFWHGMPGSRLSPKPDVDFLFEQNVRLITPDRFGYGFSTNELVTGPYDAPRYVEILSRYFGIDLTRQTVDVIGRSGGGPYALACATLRPEWINSMVCLSSLGPHFIIDNDTWHDGMGESNTKIFGAIFGGSVFGSDPEYKARREKYFSTREYIIDLATEIQRRPTALFDDEHGPEGPQGDEEHHKAASARSHWAGLRPGASAWLRDIYSYKDWGFDVEKLDPRIRSMVWCVLDDSFTPPHHSRRVAEWIGATNYVEVPTGTHFSAIDAMRDAVKWCVKNAAK